MMSYEALDAIADAYTPILFIVCLISLVIELYQQRPKYRAVGFYFSFLLGLLIVSYGLMFLDKALGLWLSFGADYSTHTAVALSLVLTLCILAPRKTKWVVGSMLAYAALMLYQEYHSILDIVSTATVIALFAMLFFRVMFNKKKQASTLLY